MKRALFIPARALALTLALATLVAFLGCSSAPKGIVTPAISFPVYRTVVDYKLHFDPQMTDMYGDYRDRVESSLQLYDGEYQFTGVTLQQVVWFWTLMFNNVISHSVEVRIGASGPAADGGPGEVFLGVYAPTYDGVQDWQYATIENDGLARVDYDEDGIIRSFELLKDVNFKTIDASGAFIPVYVFKKGFSFTVEAP